MIKGHVNALKAMQKNPAKLSSLATPQIQRELDLTAQNHENLCCGKPFPLFLWYVIVWCRGPASYKIMIKYVVVCFFLMAVCAQQWVTGTISKLSGTCCSAGEEMTTCQKHHLSRSLFSLLWLLEPPPPVRNEVFAILPCYCWFFFLPVRT